MKRALVAVISALAIALPIAAVAQVNPETIPASVVTAPGAPVRVTNCKMDSDDFGMATLRNEANREMLSFAVRWKVYDTANALIGSSVESGTLETALVPGDTDIYSTRNFGIYGVLGGLSEPKTAVGHVTCELIDATFPGHLEWKLGQTWHGGRVHADADASHETSYAAPRGSTSIGSSEAVAMQGTPIIVQLDQSLSSKDAQDNATFTFKVARQVIGGDWIVVPKGAVGQGHVVHAQSAKMLGRPGELLVSFDWVTSADGKKIRLMDAPEGGVGDTNAGGQIGVSIASSVVTEAAIQSGAALASTAVGSVVPFAGYATMLVKGKDISVGTDQFLRAYVANTVHVKSNLKAPHDSQYDQ